MAATCFCPQCQAVCRVSDRERNSILYCAQCKQAFLLLPSLPGEPPAVATESASATSASGGTESNRAPDRNDSKASLGKTDLKSLVIGFGIAIVAACLAVPLFLAQFASPRPAPQAVAARSESKKDVPLMPRVDSGEADKGSAAPQPPPASPSVQPADKGPPPEQADWGVLRLPSAVDDVCVGGGGRFLFLRLPHEHKVAVFDANEAKIVKYLPLAEDGGVFTAGREELIVALPLSNVLQRWSLATFEKEATVASPMRGALADVVMGSSSDGPLLICANGGGTFVDARTFRPIELKWTEEHMPGVAPGLVRASADGSVFGMRNDVGAEGHSVSVIAVHGDEARSHTKSILPSLLLPDFDGRYVYTKESVLNSQLGTTALPLGGGIPAHTGTFCLCEAGGRPNGAPDGAADQTTGTLSLYLPDQPGPLYVFRGVRGVVPEDLNYGGQGKGRLHYDKRIHLLPDAKLLVTIPPTNDCLLLHRFDLDELLAHSGLDYLFVASHPPASVNRGTVFTYPIVVKSRKGGVTRKLEYGPKGMTLTPDGVLRWDVPADFPDAEADVLTTIGDASGREAFQTFKLSIVGKITEAAATPTEKTPGPNDKPPSSSPPGPTLADEGFTAVKTTPPAASATGLKPAPLQEERMELRLSSAADDVCVGGGGRFLILRLPKEHKLAVFDANEAKIVKYLPLAEDDALIAAGLDKLIVALPAGNILERWSLTTFEREVRVPSPVDGAIKRLLMGSATRGPLVVGAPAEKDGLKFLDPLTFQDAGISVVPGKAAAGSGISATPRPRLALAPTGM